RLWARGGAAGARLAVPCDRLAHARLPPVRSGDVHAVGTEVTRARGGVGHRQQLGPALGAAGPLVVAEEEPLVLLDGTSDGASELIPLAGWQHLSRDRVRLIWLCERVPGLEAVTLQELERAAVEVVGPGLG